MHKTFFDRSNPKSTPRPKKPLVPPRPKAPAATELVAVYVDLGQGEISSFVKDFNEKDWKVNVARIPKRGTDTHFEAYSNSALYYNSNKHILAKIHVPITAIEKLKTGTRSRAKHSAPDIIVSYNNDGFYEIVSLHQVVCLEITGLTMSAKMTSYNKQEVIEQHKRVVAFNQFKEQTMKNFMERINQLKKDINSTVCLNRDRKLTKKDFLSEFVTKINKDYNFEINANGGAVPKRLGTLEKEVLDLFPNQSEEIYAGIMSNTKELIESAKIKEETVIPKNNSQETISTILTLSSPGQ